jgi:hypothetical protein
MGGLKMGTSGARSGLGMISKNQSAMDALGRVGAASIVKGANAHLAQGQGQGQGQGAGQGQGQVDGQTGASGKGTPPPPPPSKKGGVSGLVSGRVSDACQTNSDWWG